jgi:hypothetical protein
MGFNLPLIAYSLSLLSTRPLCRYLQPRSSPPLLLSGRHPNSVPRRAATPPSSSLPPNFPHPNPQAHRRYSLQRQQSPPQVLRALNCTQNRLVNSRRCSVDKHGVQSARCAASASTRLLLSASHHFSQLQAPEPLLARLPSALQVGLYRTKPSSGYRIRRLETRHQAAAGGAEDRLGLGGRGCRGAPRAAAALPPTLCAQACC